MKFRNTNKLFWITNSIGWILYAIVMMTLFNKKGYSDFTTFYLRVITFITGFIITLLLREIYRTVHKRNLSITYIAVSIILGSFLGSFAWYFLDIGLSFSFWEDKRIEDFIAGLSILKLMKINYSFFFILLSWGALYYGIKFFIEFQTEKLQKEEALILAQRAELEMLRYQLNPHFLFNSLNSVRGLIDENTAIAKDMITELSEFLRYTLIHKDVTFVPLSSELEAIKHYFSIEKKRFEEKLKIEYEIADEAKNQTILSLLLHPLVENAVKHGMKNSPLPLTIFISAKFSDSILSVTICNTGKWVDLYDNTNGTKTGLSNVQKRLQNAFGDKHKFEIVKHPDKVCITIEIDKSNNG